MYIGKDSNSSDSTVTEETPALQVPSTDASVNKDHILEDIKSVQLDSYSQSTSKRSWSPRPARSASKLKNIFQQAFRKPGMSKLHVSNNITSTSMKTLCGLLWIQHYPNCWYNDDLCAGLKGKILYTARRVMHVKFVDTRLLRSVAMLSEDNAGSTDTVVLAQLQIYQRPSAGGRRRYKRRQVKQARVNVYQTMGEARHRLPAIKLLDSRFVNENDTRRYPPSRWIELEVNRLSNLTVLQFYKLVV